MCHRLSESFTQIQKNAEGTYESLGLSYRSEKYKGIDGAVIEIVKENVEKKMRDQQQQFNNQEQKSTEKVGETVIAKKPSDYKEGNKNVGDYVDYEEVKDDK